MTEKHEKYLAKVLRLNGGEEAMLRRSKMRKDFYQSKEWLSIRYAALLRNGGRCQCCGATPSDGVRLHVDHVKPRSRYPHLALKIDNLQVLCSMCNGAKSNIDFTDWRPTMKKDKIGSEFGEEKILSRIKAICG